MMNGNPKAHQEYNGVMSMHVDTEMMIDFKESGLGGGREKAIYCFSARLRTRSKILGWS